MVNFRIVMIYMVVVVVDGNLVLKSRFSVDAEKRKHQQWVFPASFNAAATAASTSRQISGNGCEQAAESLGSTLSQLSLLNVFCHSIQQQLLVQRNKESSQTCLQ